MRQTGILLFALASFQALACDRAPAPVPGTSTPAAASPSVSSSPAAASPAAPADTAFPEVDVGPVVVEAFHERTGDGPADDVLPVVVVIHGLGDNPHSFWKLFQGFSGRAHFVVPAGGLKWGDGFAWWPITGQIDEKNMAAGLDAAATRLMQGIRVWRGSRAVGRPIVTGFSQGGMLSFALAAKYPQDIAEAIPVSGLLPTPMVPVAWPAGAPRPRIVALHGDADERVPFSYGKKTVESLRALGVEVDFKVYPGVGHTITAEMRRDLLAELAVAVAREARLSP